MPLAHESGRSGYGSAVQSAKGNFFDADAVLKLMGRTTRKALSKYGAFVRRRAQTSIRYRDKPAAAGQPPSAHRSMTRTKTNRKTGATKKQQVSPLRELIFFSWVPETNGVVIGPVLAPQNRRGRDGRPTSGTVPSTLEEGGSITVEEVLIKGHMVRAGTRGANGRFQAAGMVPDKWVRTSIVDRRRLAGLPTRLRAVMVRRHAFMAPADAAERPQLMQFFPEASL
jgi:hypothetical protein